MTTTQTATPETDAETWEDFYLNEVVLADHARKLELQRDAALRELAEAKKDKERLEKDIAGLRDEVEAFTI